jgi:amino acid permease
MNLQGCEGELLVLAASWGQAAFIAVFVLVLIGIFIMPRKFIGQAEVRPVWWRNVRVWAAVICCLQIIIYLAWG